MACQLRVNTRRGAGAATAQSTFLNFVRQRVPLHGLDSRNRPRVHLPTIVKYAVRGLPGGLRDWTMDTWRCTATHSDAQQQTVTISQHPTDANVHARPRSLSSQRMHEPLGWKARTTQVKGAVAHPPARSGHPLVAVSLSWIRPEKKVHHHHHRPCTYRALSVHSYRRRGQQTDRCSGVVVPGHDREYDAGRLTARCRPADGFSECAASLPAMQKGLTTPLLDRGRSAGALAAVDVAFVSGHQHTDGGVGGAGTPGIGRANEQLQPVKKRQVAVLGDRGVGKLRGACRRGPTAVR